MTLDRCWELARRWYAGRLEPEWRGRAAPASQAIFEEVGLTGSFWRMATDRTGASARPAPPGDYAPKSGMSKI